MRATADPERASHVVQIQRSLNGGAWQTLTTDSSSPVYTYVDDLATVPVGTAIRYRAILTEPDGTRVVSPVRTRDQDRAAAAGQQRHGGRERADRDRLRRRTGIRPAPPAT